MHSESPLVSVVIPAYNAGRYIRCAIDSVERQTFTDWEVIVADDGSAEDLASLLSKYARVRVVRQKHQGLSAARNLAVSHCRGRYIAFLDHDDYWEPTKLERQIAVFEADHSLALCYTNFDIVDDSGNHICGGFKGGAESYHQLLRGCCICISTVMVRRSLVSSKELFSPDYLISQDYEAWLRVAREAKIKYISSGEAHYRRHALQMSARYLVCHQEVTTILQKHLCEAQRRKDAEAVKSCMAGLADARYNYSCQAYDALRESVKQGKLDAIVHLRNTVAISGSVGFLLRNFGKTVNARVESRS